MKTLYFDLIGGTSGDMTVAALLDLGASFARLKAGLKRIKLSGYSVKMTAVERGHVKAAKFDVSVTAPKNRSYREIVRLVEKSRFKAGVKKNILRVFQELAKAEVAAHGHRHGDIRFEQLGEIDSIVDIAAACLCLDMLDVGKIVYSFIPLNKTIAAATSELLKGKKVYFTDALYENVTPTGMAILAALGEQVDPQMRRIFSSGPSGYGTGAIDPAGISNVLRVVELKGQDTGYESDEVLVIEANIDDMNPQVFDYILEKVFEAGALDVFIQPVVMKKSRPGFLLTVLSKKENFGKITGIVLSETTTIGLRFYPVQRLKLKREMQTVVFKGMKARIKVVYLPNGETRVFPEYEYCKILAKRTKIPVLEIYDRIKRKAESKWRFQG